MVNGVVVSGWRDRCNDITGRFGEQRVEPRVMHCCLHGHCTVAEWVFHHVVRSMVQPVVMVVGGWHVRRRVIRRLNPVRCGQTAVKFDHGASWGLSTGNIKRGGGR